MVFIFLAYFTLYNGLHGCFISMYDKIHYKKKKIKKKTHLTKRDTLHLQEAINSCIPSLPVKPKSSPGLIGRRTDLRDFITLGGPVWMSQSLKDPGLGTVVPQPEHQ